VLLGAGLDECFFFFAGFVAVDGSPAGAGSAAYAEKVTAANRAATNMEINFRMSVSYGVKLLIPIAGHLIRRCVRPLQRPEAPTVYPACGFLIVSMLSGI